MSKSILIAHPLNTVLAPEPIPPEWILGGNPEAQSHRLVRSRDWVSSVVVWECKAGQFRWHYGTEETILVISGEAFMINEKGEERRFATGDVGYFPAGSECTWRVPDHIKKVAVLRETMWRPIGFSLKAWNKFLRMVGLAGKSGL